MNRKLQILSALLCLLITSATDASTEKSESETTDNSLKLSKRHVDKFDVLDNLKDELDTIDEAFDNPYIDEDTVGHHVFSDGYPVIDSSEYESDEDTEDNKRDAPMGFYGQLGKRAPMGFYGQLGKRAPMGFYGQLGKRAPMGYYGQLGKRAPMGYYGQLGKRAPMGFYGQLGKRAPMGLYSQLGKRAPMGLYSQLGKRAPMRFYGQLGKRAPMGLYGQLGKRAPMGLIGQLGKRSVFSDENTDRTELALTRKRRSPIPWIPDARQPAQYWRARLIKRPNYQFYPQLG